MLKRTNRVSFLLGYALITVPTALTVTSCGPRSDSYRALVTDVEHTPVKRQSIGNCWLYATATWAESLHKIATGEDANISESYWTWWHFYDQLVRGGDRDEIDTGGNFWDAREIIRQHGLMIEGDFIADEANAQMSGRQATAESSVNAALATGGELEKPSARTPKRVTAVLDKAFGTKMSEARSRVIRARDFAAETDPSTGASAGLAEVMDDWDPVWYPMLYGEGAVETAQLAASRKAVLRRALSAANDHHPVLMSVEIDFNGLDTADGDFKGALLRDNPMGRQGGHMVVMEDYAVDNVPGVGSLEEGDLDDDMKAKALDGDIRHIKIKNSWGTNRPERGIGDGYTRFDRSYLNDSFPFGKTLDDVSWHSTLSMFVLPAGY